MPERKSFYVYAPFYRESEVPTNVPGPAGMSITPWRTWLKQGELIKELHHEKVQLREWNDGRPLGYPVDRPLRKEDEPLAKGIENAPGYT